MKIKIHNVGKLADATVEIDGITVIAGENDTGKSSVSKALYSVFSSFYHFNKSIYSQRKLEIADLLNSLLGNQFRNGRIYRFDIRQTTLLDSLADEILVLSSGCVSELMVAKNIKVQATLLKVASLSLSFMMMIAGTAI